MQSLLPSNRTGFEQALELSVSRPLPNLLNTLWHPDSCPAELLGQLAWGLNIDVWDDAWAERDKREVLKNALYVHQHKGTLSAVKSAVADAGLGNTTVTEGVGGQWAQYGITIDRALNPEQTQAAKALIAAAAPARCKLVQLDFTANAILRNGTVLRNGQYTRGVIAV